MNSDEPTLEYEIAEGPEGLTQVLNTLLERSKHDPVFAGADHYVMYQLGNQRSLIKIDTSQEPYHFWYCDMLGRPATNIIKETIADFLWEKGGLKEQYLQKSVRS